MRTRCMVLALAMAFAPLTNAQTAKPPMGWNSWDAYGLTITEAQFRDNVRVLHEKLQPFGYRYAVIDEGWFFANPEDRPQPEKLAYAIDRNGRYVPVPERFPSGGRPPMVLKDVSPVAGQTLKLRAGIFSTTFKPLADFVHAQGLLFGIHIVRGIPRASVERNLPIAHSKFTTQDAADTADACPWDPTNWGVKDTPAGQAWYDSLLAQYAQWGVDLLKVDCISDHPYKADEIRMIRRAIDKVTARTHRPIVLSLSPGPTALAHAAEVASLATMWRISDDVWDVWQPALGKDGKPSNWPQTIKGQFDRAAQWRDQSLNIPAGHYPDLDMLPVGELRPSPGWGQPRTTRLTPDEQRSLLTLWAMSQSPLILGANLTLLDDATLTLLTNPEVLRIDQHATAPGHQVSRTGDLVIWEAKFPRAGKPLTVRAYFNLGDATLQQQVDSPPTVSNRSEPLLEVWSGKRIGADVSYLVSIPPHGCILVELP